MALPGGEEADAVAGAHDGVEVVLELVKGQVLVNDLGSGEGGNEVEGDRGHDAERAEVDDGVAKGVAVLGAGKLDDVAVGGDDLEAGNLRRQVAVVDSRTVRRRGDGAGHRDVRQGGQVVQGEALGVEQRSELAVGDTGADAGGVGGGVDLDRVEAAHADLGEATVGDVVETVARTERLQLRGLAHDGLHVGHGLGRVDVVGAVVEVLGPVGAGDVRVVVEDGGVGLSVGHKGGKHASGEKCC